jgi:hypothetical protein
MTPSEFAREIGAGLLSFPVTCSCSFSRPPNRVSTVSTTTRFAPIEIEPADFP